jgi:hypothetical protein
VDGHGGVCEGRKGDRCTCLKHARHPDAAYSAIATGAPGSSGLRRSGGVYRYFDFSPEQYRDLLGAESKNRFFLSQIRNQFRYERLARLAVANLK